MKYPKLTHKFIEQVDATPDIKYPLRILQTYRENCNCKWSTDTQGNCDNELFKIMNEHTDQRAKILDKALEILKKYMLN